MNNLALRRLTSGLTFYSRQQRSYRKKIRQILGERPYYTELYLLASLHASVSRTIKNGNKVNNERLEYLGDAVLSAVVAEFLYQKYPTKSEGFLTDIRSRIVNRDTMNRVAASLGIDEFINHSLRKWAVQLKRSSVLGNCLEAFIGAVYLDKGYRSARRFIINRIINQHIDLDILIEKNPNHKSKIIEYAQKENKAVEFRILEEKMIGNHKQYTAEVVFHDQPLAHGYGKSKKKAEQDAARKGCEILNIG